MLLSPQKTTLAVSSAWQTMFGDSAEGLPVADVNWKELLEGSLQGFEHRVQSRAWVQQQRLAIQWDIRPWREAEQVAGVLLQATDVTQLQADADRIRNIFDHMLQFVGLLAADGTLLDANETLLRYCGASRDEVIGKPFWEAPWWAKSNEKSDRIRKAVIQAQSGKVVQNEISLDCKHGQQVMIEYSLTPVLDECGNVAWIVPEARDITAKREAEHKYEQAQQMFDTFMSHGPFLAWIKDEQLRYTFVNDTFKTDMGLEPSWVIGKTDSHILPPTTARMCHMGDEQVLREMQPLETLESRGGGEKFAHTLVYKFPLIQPNGKCYLGGIAIDITQQIESEEKLHRLNLELEQKVMERTRALEISNEHISQMAFTIAHDLKAPLRYISSFARILGEDARPRLLPDEADSLDHIIESSERLTELIEELLEYAQRSKQEVVLRRVSMQEIMDRIQSILRAQSQGQQVRWDIGVLPDVMGDPGLLSQIWINLLSNAIKFSQHQEVAKIKVRATRQDDTFVFSVEDNGIGFDPDKHDLMFQLFQRLHSQSGIEGTGMGLAHVKKIVEMHHGHIWAKGRPGEGATFFFSLPVMEANATPVPMPLVVQDQYRMPLSPPGSTH